MSFGRGNVSNSLKGYRRFYTGMKYIYRCIYIYIYIYIYLKFFIEHLFILENFQLHSWFLLSSS